MNPITEREKAVRRFEEQRNLRDALAASADAMTEEGETPGVDAVAAGSLPVSSAEAIIQKWSEHRNFAAHQQQRAPMGTLERRAWKERRNLIEEMLDDMGRLAGLPIPRQPEENKKIS